MTVMVMEELEGGGSVHGEDVLLIATPEGC